MILPLLLAVGAGYALGRPSTSTSASRADAEVDAARRASRARLAARAAEAAAGVGRMAPPLGAEDRVRYAILQSIPVPGGLPGGMMIATGVNTRGAIRPATGGHGISAGHDLYMQLRDDVVTGTVAPALGGLGAAPRLPRPPWVEDRDERRPRPRR